MRKFTHYQDEQGQGIFTGDILLSEHGYHVLVCEADYGFYGALISPIEHSCHNIPYDLNNGRKHRVVLRTGTA
jgi:hypothetical protein